MLDQTLLKRWDLLELNRQLLMYDVFVYYLTDTDRSYVCLANKLYCFFLEACSLST